MTGEQNLTEWRPAPRPNVARWLLAAIPVALFVVSIWGIHRELAHTSVRHIGHLVGQYGASTLLAAALLAGLSHLAMGLQDTLALRILKQPMAQGRALVIALACNAIGRTAGTAALSAGMLRWRFYAPLGLSATEAGYVSVFSELGMGLGLTVLLGVALTFAAAAAPFGLSSASARGLGAFALALPCAYVLAALWHRAPLTMGVLQAPMPKPNQAFGHVLLGALDSLCAALALTVLLEQEPAHVLPTFAAFAVAAVAGAASGIPGGLGAFEATLLLLSPAPNPELAAALVLFRVLYYLAPLSIAAAGLALAQRRAPLAAAKRATSTARGLARNIAPQAIGALVAVAGLILLLSGASPALDARMALLERFLPLAVVETSHLLGSVSGFALLVLAHGLFRRLCAAQHLAMIVLGLGAVASLAKGLDFEEASVMFVAMAVLALGRDAFDRRSSLLDEPFSLVWIATIAVLVGASVWLGLFAYRHVEYGHELWWQFEFQAGAPRFLRATLAVAIAAAAIALWRLLHPPRRIVARTGAAERAEAEAIVAESARSDAMLALVGDKSFLFSEARDAFLMFGVRGRSSIAFSDPVGRAERADELLWRFRENCDKAGVRPVHYQIDGAELPRYIDLGFSFVKLGEEARVLLSEFDLKGKRWANLRHSKSQAERAGARFEVIQGEAVQAILPQLKTVSDAWLASKNTREKGFTVGHFDAGYLSCMPCAVMRRDNEIVAFANVLHSGHKEEISIDLMRYLPDAPSSTMDYLFAELCSWARDQGFLWANLGLAPLSGLETRRFSPLWHKLGALVFQHGEHFYNFAGIRQYKEKFRPLWRPKYMATEGGLNAVAALIDAAALISGGYRGIFRK